MAEEIGFENGRNSNFQGLMTLTLDPAIRHTVVHHSSTSTSYLYTKFHWNRRNFLWTDGRTYGRTDIFPPLILLGRLLEVDLKMSWPWQLGYGSVNVTANVTMRYSAYDFLLTFYSNYGSISCHFWNYLTSKTVVTLKSGPKVTQGHWKWYH